MTSCVPFAAALLGAWISLGAWVSLAAAAEPAGSADPGKVVYERANCVGCHKWSGGGGGGYGGAALSLRATQLTREQIVETVRCGRPGTGMPHFTADPYRDKGCYGLEPDDVATMMPPEANLILRPREIDAVADYVLANIKGKGDPTLADCTGYFGDASRVCDTYRPHEAGVAVSRHVMPTPSTTGQ